MPPEFSFAVALGSSAFGGPALAWPCPVSSVTFCSPVLEAPVLVFGSPPPFLALATSCFGGGPPLFSAVRGCFRPAPAGPFLSLGCAALPRLPAFFRFSPSLAQSV